jgi:hypothetical protein
MECLPVVFVDRDVDALAHYLTTNQESPIISLRKQEFHLAERTGQRTSGSAP